MTAVGEQPPQPFARQHRGSWRQYAPLICGLLSLVVIPIQFTSVLWLGITVFSAGYVVLGVAALSDGVRRADHAIQLA